MKCISFKGIDKPVYKFLNTTMLIFLSFQGYNPNDSLKLLWLTYNLLMSYNVELVLKSFFRNFKKSNFEIFGSTQKSFSHNFVVLRQII